LAGLAEHFPFCDIYPGKCCFSLGMKGSELDSLALKDFDKLMLKLIFSLLIFPKPDVL